MILKSTLDMTITWSHFKKSFDWITLCGILFLISPITNANIIDDTHGVGAGSFELGIFVNGSGSTPFFVNAGYMGLAPGATTITGWTVGGPGDGIDWLIDGPGNVFTFNANDGIHSVDLQHLTASSISTVIPTVTGGVYELSFFAASVVSYDNTGTVSAGSLINQSFTVAGPYSTTFENQTFQQFSYSFSAIDTLTTIQFTGTDPISAQLQYGPVIDSVSVTLTNAVPLPPTMFLFGSGILALAGVIRRKKQ
jgi:hypothetical protein